MSRVYKWSIDVDAPFFILKFLNRLIKIEVFINYHRNYQKRKKGKKLYEEHFFCFKLCVDTSSPNCSLYIEFYIPFLVMRQQTKLGSFFLLSFWKL